MIFKVFVFGVFGVVALASLSPPDFEALLQHTHDFISEHALHGNSKAVDVKALLTDYTASRHYHSPQGDDDNIRRDDSSLLTLDASLLCKKKRASAQRATDLFRASFPIYHILALHEQAQAEGADLERELGSLAKQDC